jgi:6-phosphogluconolactonase
LVLRVDPRVHVYPDLGRASKALAEVLVRLATEAVAERGRFRCVISGGHTPLPLFDLLAGPRGRGMPWGETEVFFADERCVPPRHSDSNFGAAWAAFLSMVPIPRRQVHRVRGELRPPSRAASEYARLLGSPSGPRGVGKARFDVVLLGIGPDGHTASLFPNSPALRERQRTVVSVRRPAEPPYVPRVTMTLPALRSSHAVLFLVSGRDKAAALRGTLHARSKGSPRWPASLVRSSGAVRWFVDRYAASALSNATRGAPPR